MKTRLSFYLALVFILLTSLVFAQKPLGWLGPDRSGIYPETGLLKSWPAAGPKLLWETSEIGTGYSSATVTDDAIYITGRRGENDYLTCFTQDGKKRWEVNYGKASESNFPDTRGTATVAGGKIFLVSGMGDLVCINKEGKILWSVNYCKKYEEVIPDFGISECPLVIGNKVIATPGGKKASMVAYNAENGSVIWETPSIGDVTQYVNPIVIEYSGKQLIITLSAKYLFAVDAATGKLQWTFDYMAQCTAPEWRFAHINTPLYRDGCLLISSGYDKVALRLKLNPGTTAPTVVWRNEDFDPHVGGAILVGDYLYGSNYESSSYGKWMCVDWKTGNTMWKTDWYNKGSLISADGMIYIYEEKTGHVGLVKPGPAKLDVVSEFRVTKGNGPYWAYPMIDKGRLFVRHGGYMAVYSIK